MTRAGRARRKLGQNFLVDRSAVSRIVAALDPHPGDAVLEIGPGRGALTAALIDRVGCIAAVELDARLAAELRRRFDERQLRLIEDDVLRVNLASVLEALARPASSRLIVVGNLPYHISKPLALELVEQRASVERAVLMFQREVADRLVSPPGAKSYGPLTVLTGMVYRVSRLFVLPPASFRPRPKVESAVTRWERRDRPGFEAEIAGALRSCLAASFARRRQNLRNNLRAALGSTERAEALLDAARLAGTARAEAVPPEGFLRLARAWPSATSE